MAACGIRAGIAFIPRKDYNRIDDNGSDAGTPSVARPAGEPLQTMPDRAAFLLLSLLPLLVLSLYARQKLVEVGQTAVDSSRQALTQNAMTLLEARARAIAQQVELFLLGVADDLKSLGMLPPDPERYRQFHQVHQRHIWVRTGSPQRPEEIRPLIPLYREIAYADADGIERIRTAGSTRRRGASRPPFAANSGRKTISGVPGRWPPESFTSRASPGAMCARKSSCAARPASKAPSAAGNIRASSVLPSPCTGKTASPGWPPWPWITAT